MPLTKEDSERLTEHMPVGLLVELVEFRFRDRLKRIFWAGLSTLLMAMLAISGISSRLQDSARERELAEIESTRQSEVDAERERQRQRRVDEHTASLSRAGYRLQYARTPRSFERATEALEVGASLPVELQRGARRQFSVNATGGRHSVRISDAQRAPGAPDSPVPFTPVMYLYQQNRNDIVVPLNHSTRSLLSFSHTDAGIYYLEVEELLGDPGGFTLTLLE